MKKLLMMASLLGTLMFTACSSDEDIATTGNKIEVSDDQFTFTTEDFGTDEGVTRAAASATTNAAPTKPQTIDLGGGLEAEVSVEQDAPAAQTRATKPISDGHYTVYAVDNTGTRVTGANSKVSGTVSGGKFTKDAGTKLELTPGTYTFVCFNDAVTDNGTNLTVNNGADALIGTSTETISGTGWKVNFLMKHQTARVRFRITGYTDQAAGVTANFVSTSAQPIANTYSVDASTTTATTGTVSNAYTLPATSTTYNATYIQAHDFVTDYTHLLPGIPASDMKLNFTGGTLYGTALTGKSFSLSNLASLNFARNHSYTVNIKLKGVLYLFEDGTVGVLAEKGSRTPIGVVAREKTNTEEGMAAALDVIKNHTSAYGYNAYPWEDESVTGHSTPIQLNTTVYNGIWDGQNDMNGYNWTWDAASTTDGVVRANEQTKYPAFYMAGHYTPSVPVTGSNIGKWYIPAVGEVLQLYKMFGTPTIPASEPWRGYVDMTNVDINKLKNAFHNANSSLDSYDITSEFLWTSTTQDAAATGGTGAYAPISFLITNGWFPSFSKAGANFYILPFVKF